MDESSNAVGVAAGFFCRIATMIPAPTMTTEQMPMMMSLSSCSSWGLSWFCIRVVSSLSVLATAAHAAAAHAAAAEAPDPAPVRLLFAESSCRSVEEAGARAWPPPTERPTSTFGGGEGEGEGGGEGGGGGGGGGGCNGPPLE